MPRASRHFLPGQLWHITHRCHEKAFLLKFARDRRAYLHWLFEAKKRFGLRMLNFVVTSNHVHLLVKDTVEGVIAQSMQLAAGRTAQRYNQRKGRQGAFWEDRYHATAIEADEHLHRCLVYIDLNMVRAGVVRHPAEWAQGGYRQIQDPPERYAVIELADLSDLCGFTKVVDFQRAHRQWVEEALAREPVKRDERWSEAIAVGSPAFVEKVKRELGMKARHRDVDEADGTCVLREPRGAYAGTLGTENSALRSENAILWAENPANA
jgi:REP element-mobilizing transposase RayT